ALRVRHTGAGAFGNGRVAQEYFLDFRRSHLVAADVDQLALAARQPEIAAFIAMSEVAGAQPAIRERPGRERRIAPVFTHEVSAADLQPALDPGRRFLPGGEDHA